LSLPPFYWQEELISDGEAKAVLRKNRKIKGGEENES